MLLIGDSTLLAVDRYNGYEAFRGFDYVYDAESCRTLGIPSCGDGPVPPNAVEAIGAADGNFDDVVIMAGYDEWWNSFPDSFDEVVAAARAKGARNIIWLTYPEGVEYKLLTGERADEAFIKNNQTLRDKVASGAVPGCAPGAVVPAHPRRTTDGSPATAFISQSTAPSVWLITSPGGLPTPKGMPCPMPTVPGGAIEPICSNPDTQPPIVDVRALYDT